MHRILTLRTSYSGDARISIHVYYLSDWQRKSQLLALAKLLQRPTAENVTEVLIHELKTRLSLNESGLAQRIILGAADGARTLQGSASGVLHRVRQAAAPWALQMHCMAHRIDLCAEAIDNHAVAGRVVDLLRKAYDLFSRSPNRKQLLEANQTALGLPKLVMLRDVATRWISHFRPLERVLGNLSPLLLTCADIQDGKAGNSKATSSELMERLTNYSTIIAAAALRPLLYELQILIKLLQVQDVYIVDLMDSIAAATSKIQSLYDSLTGFAGTEFLDFLRLTTPSHQQCPIVQTYDIHGSRVMAYKIVRPSGSEDLFTVYAEVPSSGRKGTSKRPREFQQEEIPAITQHVRFQVEKCATAVIAQLQERMGEPELLRSLGIVFPQTFDAFDAASFQVMVDTFSSHFGVGKNCLEPPIDSLQLKVQQEDFVKFALERAVIVKADPEDAIPRVVRFWRSLDQFETVRKLCPSWFVAAQIALTVVSGSVADERVFSAMNFVKNDLRNRLSTHLESCVQTYTQDLFDISTFPYNEMPQSTEDE